LDFEETRPDILKIFDAVVSSDPDGDEFPKVNEAIQSSQHRYLKMKTDTLQSIISVLKPHPLRREHFVRHSGIACLLAILMHHADSFLKDEPNELGFELLRQIFSIMILLFHNNLSRKKIWIDDHGFPNFTHHLIETNILHSQEHVACFFDHLLGLAIGELDSAELVSANKLEKAIENSFQNPEFIAPVILELLANAPVEIQLPFLRKFAKLLSFSFPGRVQVSSSGVLRSLIKHYQEHLSIPPDPLKPSEFQKTLVNLILEIAPLNITPTEVADLFRLVDPTKETPPKPHLLSLILNSLKKSRSPDYVVFDLTKRGTKCIEMASLPSWPPSPGYTFSTWIRINQFDCDASSRPLQLFSIGEDGEYLQLEIFNVSKMLHLVLNKKDSLTFNDFKFETGNWYHVVICHSKGKLATTPSIQLFIDGIHCNTQKFTYIATPLPTLPQASPANPPAYFGTPGKKESASNNVWELGPSFFVEEVLEPAKINAIFNVGPRYHGSFQGPLVKYMTNEVIDSVNLDSNGRTAESLSTSTGHKIFSIDNLLVQEEKFWFIFHPHRNAFSLQRSDQGTETKEQWIWNSALPKETENLDQCGVLVGNLTLFHHHTFSEMLRNLGGIPVLLKIIESSEVAVFLAI